MARLSTKPVSCIARPFPGAPSTAEKLENAYVLELQQRVVELENQNQKLRELIDYEKGSEPRHDVASSRHWAQRRPLVAANYAEQRHHRTMSKWAILQLAQAD